MIRSTTLSNLGLIQAEFEACNAGAALFGGHLAARAIGRAWRVGRGFRARAAEPLLSRWRAEWLIADERARASRRTT